MISKVVPDSEMPYLVETAKVDQYGVKHPVGKREIVDCVTNSLAVPNRTIPLAMEEGSVTFVVDRTRKHAATLSTVEEKAEFIIDVISILNAREGKEIQDLYNKMNQSDRKKFVNNCINLNPDGTLNTSDGIYIRWEAFSDTQCIRDSLIVLYDKYPEVFKPYEIFNPKPKWGRDIYIGSDYIGYQYMMMLKQSAEKGFIVRAGGAISDEGLPEKTNSKKVGTSWASCKPIRFGEYDTPGFLVIANPEDFALITALYRSSLDGRKYMCEAILSDDGLYNLPDYFASRTVQVMQVYFKSLGVGMDCINEDDEIIGWYTDENEEVMYELQDAIIQCTIPEKLQLRKIHKVFRRYVKENISVSYDIDEVWEYIMDNLPFKKKKMLPRVPDMFKKYISYFARTKEDD